LTKEKSDFYKAGNDWPPNLIGIGVVKLFHTSENLELRHKPHIYKVIIGLLNFPLDLD
jgi:hypothetical protein